MRNFIFIAIVFLTACSNQNNESTQDSHIFEISKLTLDVNSPVQEIDLGESSLSVKELSEKITVKNTTARSIVLTPSIVGQGFKIKINRCSTLDPKKSCDITVSFANRGLFDSEYQGTLSLNPSLDIALKASVAGNANPETSGTPQLTLELDSPFEPLGSLPYRTLTIKNEGTGIAKEITTSLPSEYSIRLNRCPTDLAPKKSCTIQVLYKNHRSSTPPPDGNISVGSQDQPPVVADVKTGDVVEGGTPSCQSGEHLEEGVCVTSERACSIIPEGALVAVETYSNGSWGNCQITACNSGYHLDQNSCVLNSISCPIENGVGVSIWNEANQSYNSCVATSCDSSYILDNGACASRIQEMDLNSAKEISCKIHTYLADYTTQSSCESEKQLLFLASTPICPPVQAHLTECTNTPGCGKKGLSNSCQAIREAGCNFNSRNGWIVIPLAQNQCFNRPGLWTDQEGTILGKSSSIFKHSSGKIFFKTEGITFSRLYVSLGNSSSTISLVDGYEKYDFETIAEFNGKIYFGATGLGQSGARIWESDGTVLGTREVGSPQSCGSSCYGLNILATSNGITAYGISSGSEPSSLNLYTSTNPGDISSYQGGWETTGYPDYSKIKYATTKNNIYFPLSFDGKGMELTKLVNRTNTNISNINTTGDSLSSNTNIIVLDYENDVVLFPGTTNGINTHLYISNGSTITIVLGNVSGSQYLPEVISMENTFSDEEALYFTTAISGTIYKIEKESFVASVVKSFPVIGTKIFGKVGNHLIVSGNDGSNGNELYSINLLSNTSTMFQSENGGFSMGTASSIITGSNKAFYPRNGNLSPLESQMDGKLYLLANGSLVSIDELLNVEFHTLSGINLTEDSFVISSEFEGNKFLMIQQDSPIIGKEILIYK